jgi:hypothetical protein
MIASPYPFDRRGASIDVGLKKTSPGVGYPELVEPATALLLDLHADNLARQLVANGSEDLR